VVELTAGQSASAGLYAGELLKFAVKLLNGPADVVFMVGSDNVQGLDLVGEEAVCPMGDTRTRKGFNLQSLVISFAFMDMPYSTSTVDQPRQATESTKRLVFVGHVATLYSLL